ncbi:hypothetical protein [Halorussus litoreus]|uniref:hypothetical protein n=1 Tax=Halorussus litoreus TaxID=1710536 RepID=UPI0018E555B8|nr:hypothetical protein [Halorussus litoreus]
MPEEKRRVNFNAPEPLVRQADIVTDLLDVSRTRLLVEALQDEIEEFVDDEQFQKELREAYYDRRVEFSSLKTVLGTEEAMRVRMLRESLDRDVPEPRDGSELPTQEEFYAEPVSEWTPDGQKSSTGRADDREPDEERSGS